MYTLVESFCLGARRLEIFGRRRPGHQLRRGWVTVLLGDDGDMGAVDRVDEQSMADEKIEIDSRASSVAGDDDDDEETEIKTEAQLKAEMDLEVLRTAKEKTEMEGLEGAVLWEKETWEREVRESCQVPPGGRVVVPSTPGEFMDLSPGRRTDFCYRDRRPPPKIARPRRPSQQ